MNMISALSGSSVSSNLVSVSSGKSGYSINTRIFLSVGRGGYSVNGSSSSLFFILCSLKLIFVYSFK